MAVINTSGSFANNEQVTSTKLNDLIDQAYFVNNAVSGSTLAVTAGGQLKVGTITATEMGDNSVEAAAIKNGEVTPAKLSAGGPAWDNISTTAITNNNVSGAYFINLCTSRSGDGNTTLQFGSQTGTIANASITRGSGADGWFIFNQTGAGRIEIKNLNGSTVFNGPNGIYFNNGSSSTCQFPLPDGTAPIYGARAWVNFDATRNAAGGSDTANTDRYIRSSKNVTKVTKTGTGLYDLLMTTALSDANYVVTGSCNENGSNEAGRANNALNGFASTSTIAKISTIAFGSSGINCAWNSVIVFG